jgi:hypothetical protein
VKNIRHLPLPLTLDWIDVFLFFSLQKSISFHLSRKAGEKKRK